MFIFWSITISNIIWIAYAMSEGVRESFFKHYKNQCKRCDKYKFDIISSLQRLIVLFTTSLIFINTIGFFSIPFIIGQICMFNFFHKISYKQTCKKIGDNSIVEPTIIEKLKSTASYLLILGVGLQIFVYIFLV